MAADTYTNNLGLIMQGTGNNNNSWGTTFNASFAALVDRALAGQNVHAVTGGTLDLSGSAPPAGPSQAIDLCQTLSGTLTSNQTLILPNNTAIHIVSNVTTGAFSVLVKMAAAVNTIEIPQGTTKFIFCSASNFVVRMDLAEVGMIGSFGGASLPAGWMACNGASLVRTDHPDLFNAIGTAWGAADGTHFNVPNLTDTGRFLRSSSGSLSVGTYQSNQNAAHVHTATSTFSSGVTDSQGAHTHTATPSDPGHAHTFSGGNGVPWGGGSGSSSGAGSTFAMNVLSMNGAATGISVSIGSAGAHTHNVTGTVTTTVNSQGGAEARPEAAVVLFGIRY